MPDYLVVSESLRCDCCRQDPVMQLCGFWLCRRHLEMAQRVGAYHLMAVYQGLYPGR